MNKNEETKINPCKICGNPTTPLLDPKQKVTYDVCHTCDFIFKQTTYHLSPIEEKARYDTHNNDTEDEGYINIFKTLLQVHVAPLKHVKNILDFGSGPYPMLQKVFAEAGYNVTIFDPYYHKDLRYKEKHYDMVISTEVFEHLSDPMKEIEAILPLINENGYLVIMTHFRTMDQNKFLSWWYKRDQTHIAFFHPNTFEYIKHKYHLIEVSNNHKHTIVFQKKS